MEHYRCIYYYFAITTFTLITGIQCQDLIGPSPKQAALVGQTHTLTCSKASNVPDLLTWFDDTDGSNIQLYFGTNQVSFQTKYDNLGVVSDTAEQLDLQITDIAVEDEGIYGCQIAGTSLLQQVILTVEVRASSLDMTQGGSNTTLVTVREEKPSEITCTAVGARPAVTIDWYHRKDNGSETKITDGVSQVDTPNGDTFDSESTLMYTATKDYNGGSLRCVTTGQEVAENRQVVSSLNVQYAPVVEILYEDNTVTCTLDANPVATSPVIIVNDTIAYTSPCDDGACNLALEVDYDTAVRCNATNLVGSGTATTLAIPARQPVTAIRMATSLTGGRGGNGVPTNTSSNVGGVLGVFLGISIIITILLF